MRLFSRLFSSRSASVAPEPSNESMRPAVAALPVRTNGPNVVTSFFSRFFTVGHEVYASEEGFINSVTTTREQRYRAQLLRRQASSESVRLPGQASSTSSEEAGPVA